MKELTAEEKRALEILRKYYQSGSHYVREAAEMKGQELYHSDKVLLAMEEYKSQSVNKILGMIDAFMFSSKTNDLTVLKQQIESEFLTNKNK